MYANACSIINKFVAFEAMVCNYEPNVIGIAESWAHDGIVTGCMRVWSENRLCLG